MPTFSGFEDCLKGSWDEALSSISRCVGVLATSNLQMVMEHCSSPYGTLIFTILLAATQQVGRG